MKWIGQHIVDLLARFRSSIYLEDVANPGVNTDKIAVLDSEGLVGYRTASELKVDIGAVDTTLTQEQVEDFVDGLVTAGTNVTVTYDDGAGTLTFDATDTNTTYTGSAGVRLSGTDFSLDALYDAVFNSLETDTVKSRANLDLVMDVDGSSSGDKISFKEKNNEVGSIDDKGNLQVDGTVTGKLTQMYQMSFHDDMSTTKHWVPWGGTLEQSANAYQEEVAMAMPYGGRIVSCLVRTNSLTGTGNLTIGIETKEPGATVGSSWTLEETEVLALSSTDDNHAFHFVFSNSAHFDPGDLTAISIQASSDLSGSTYWYVTTVVQFDINDPLGTSSAEYDTGQ